MKALVYLVISVLVILAALGFWAIFVAEGGSDSLQVIHQVYTLVLSALTLVVAIYMVRNLHKRK